MSDRPKKTRVAWYRSPVSREALYELNKRNDVKGFIQTGGYLGLLTLTCGAAIYSAYHWSWYVTIAVIFFHGTCWHFLINGFHELVHDSVFTTRWLNRFFLLIFSFLGWHNHHHFWASHTEHHKYTLHPPDDLEVVLPQTYTLKEYLKTGFVNLRWPYDSLKQQFRLALGHVWEDHWTQALFPETDPKARRDLINWARILLVGHGLIIGVSLAMGWWMVPIVVSLTPAYGGWLHFLCNNTQHAGLKDNVPDLRVCCRTIYLNPFLQFLYWYMNYHTEHHMYAAVPCYNLGKLHRLIKSDLPHCPNGLIETWTQIVQVLKRQKVEPSYQYEPELPTPALRSPAEGKKVSG